MIQNFKMGKAMRFPMVDGLFRHQMSAKEQVATLFEFLLNLSEIHSRLPL
jgi:hypothetical protein